MTSPKQPRKSRIPRFKTLQEEAAFWDTHDTAEFGDEFKEVRARFGRPLDHILAVRLEARTIAQLGKVAERLGIGPSTLVRMWVMERLRELDNKESHPSEIRIEHPVS